MKISVVTISFNQSKYLRQCIDSVLSQNYSDIEYIIVDPGSTDGSREIIESYGDRVVKIFDQDVGPADGLNKGFRIATGDIFYFINSDDFVYPGAFCHIAEIFKGNLATNLVLAAGDKVDATAVKERSFYPSFVSKRSYVYGAVTFFQQGMFFSSDLFKRSGGFNIENRTCWDGELLLNFLRNSAKIERTMYKVAAFRVYSESITGSQRFSSQYDIDQKRLFELVLGSQKKSILISIYFRFKKIFLDPSYAFKKFSDIVKF